MKTRYLLDASALLAALFDEPGARRVEEILEQSGLSVVNFSEVVTRQIKLGAKPEVAVSNLQRLELPLFDWTEELAASAADLSPLAWTHGLAFGDRACLATARLKGLTAVTTDRAWADLPPFGVAVEVIR